MTIAKSGCFLSLTQIRYFIFFVISDITLIRNLVDFNLKEKSRVSKAKLKIGSMKTIFSHIDQYSHRRFIKLTIISSIRIILNVFQLFSNNNSAL